MVVRSVLLFALAVPAWCQPGRTLTARELFYAPVPDAAPAGQHGPVKGEAKSAPQAKGQKKVARAKPAPAPNPAPAHPEDVAPALPDGGRVVPARYGAAVPLGLRYSVLKGEAREEVSGDSVFHGGDGIRLSVEANGRAYLYVVLRGSSGVWKVLFPSPEIDGGSNVVERGRRHEIPPGGRFTFDQQPGTEKLFLVLTRRPEPDLERLIYSLSPASDPQDGRRPPQKLIALNVPPIDDGLVGRLRNAVQARDLVFEKVDESTSGDRKEKAMYIVNPSGAPDSRLVADIVFKHE